MGVHVAVGVAIAAEKKAPKAIQVLCEPLQAGGTDHHALSNSTEPIIHAYALTAGREASAAKPVVQRPSCTGYVDGSTPMK